MIFKDRADAGQKLISKLKRFKDKPEVVVLGLPRGGVVVAFEIARGLRLPLDLVVPRKIGAPNDPEFAIGAIAEDGTEVLDEMVVAAYKISQDYINKQVEVEKKEAERRLKVYLGKSAPISLRGKTAILADDGIATGYTMLAAIKSVKAKGAEKIIVAVPVTARDSLEKLKREVDEVIYLDAPLYFGAVGAFYKNFPQTEDREVVDLLKKAALTST